MDGVTHGAKVNEKLKRVPRVASRPTLDEWSFTLLINVARSYHFGLAFVRIQYIWASEMTYMCIKNHADHVYFRNAGAILFAT